MSEQEIQELERQQRRSKQRRDYLLGLAWTLPPLIIFLIVGGLNSQGLRSLSLRFTLFGPGSVFYIGVLFSSLLCLFNKERRFLGYGLLTAALLTPVVAVYGCQILTSIQS